MLHVRPENLRKMEELGGRGLDEYRAGVLRKNRLRGGTCPSAEKILSKKRVVLEKEGDLGVGGADM